MTTPETTRVEADDPSIVQTTAEELRPLYRQMLAVRRMEEAAAKGYSQGKIGGFLHLIIGQEAVCVGAVAAAEDKDYVVATYREHGHAYAKGVCVARDPRRAVRQEDRAGEGPRRLDAPVRQVEELPRRLRHRRRPRADRSRRGVRRQVPRRWPRRAVLLRRRRVDDRRLRRGPRARSAVEAAGRVHLREQPVLDGHAAVPLARGRGRLAAGDRATAWPATASTATTSSRSSVASPRRSSARARPASRRLSRS